MVAVFEGLLLWTYCICTTYYAHVGIWRVYSMILHTALSNRALRASSHEMNRELPEATLKLICIIAYA